MKPKLEQKERLEWEAVPVFKNNPFYRAVFLGIPPVCEAHEEPTPKQIFDYLTNNCQGKKVIFDDTCFNTIREKTRTEDFPKKFNLSEVPVKNNKVDMDKIKKLFKKYFKIEISSIAYETIDQRISETFDYYFSPALIEQLFKIVKIKKLNIKTIYILSDKVHEHVASDSFTKKKVLQILKAKAKEVFNIEPKILTTIDKIADEHVLVVADRHNQAITTLKLDESYPTQIIMLPFATAMLNLKEAFKDTDTPQMSSSNYIEEIRTIFKKQS